jgi:hypothetical protein
MQCTNDYSTLIKHNTLAKLILLFSFLIWSINPLVAHEPEPEKDKAILPDEVFSSKEVYFSHIHGIGYSNDGTSILVASHVGIMLYTNGQWIVPDLPAHDYMGFAPIDEGFYSSGHPALKTDLLNPLGLVKVSNKGKELTLLAFAGVFDFHQLAAGYYSHAIYVITSVSHPQLKSGLNYSLDEGKTWAQSGTHGVVEWASQIAVHPTDVSTVAVATTKGLYLSKDFGKRYERLTDDNIITAVSFSPDGQFLAYGHQTIERYLLSNRKTGSISYPDISKDDFVTYIAINPIRTNEIAIVTKKKNISAEIRERN